MILKSFELKNINLNFKKHILFYGKNDGAKKEEIDKILENKKELTVIRYDEKENEGAYFFEDSQKIYIDFYVADSFIQELKEDKITSYYNRYVKPESSFGDKTTLEDDVNIYIRENIIPRFLIDSIKIYGKQIAGSSSELNSISDVEDISSGGYLELTNFEIRSFAEKPLDFRLIYNKKPGYSYKLRVHSKIIA